MWPFSSSTKSKHKDEVTAFKYREKLYPSLHAMNAQKEKDVKREATKELKRLLYGLAIPIRELNVLHDWEQEAVIYRVERDFVFRGGERDIENLAELLIDHWPFIRDSMSDYFTAKRKLEES